MTPKLSAPKVAAYCAVECAILIVAQLVLGAVSGVELVSVLLMTFSAYFGVVCAVCSAICFSLLRCLIWGFYPTVIILYLIYYPLFAFIFAMLGKSDCSATLSKLLVANLVLIFIGCACAVAAALKLIKISRLYARTTYALLWAVFGVCAALIFALNAIYVAVKLKKLPQKYFKLFIFCTLACALCTLFTLMDDVITPLFYGYSKETALAYFYTSLLAMLPQLICVAATTLTLYFPLTYAYSKACPMLKCIDKRFKK